MVKIILTSGWRTGWEDGDVDKVLEGAGKVDGGWRDWNEDGGWGVMTERQFSSVLCKSR